MAQVGVASGVALRLLAKPVASAIDLDAEAGARAEEVENIRTEGVLSAEHRLAVPATAEAFPQHHLW